MTRPSRFDLLFGSSEPPDPFGNAAGRWYFVLARGLSERGHRVRWLSSFLHEASVVRARAALEHTTVQLKTYPYQHRSWLQQKLATVRRPYGYFISDAFARDMDAERRRGYDVLQLEQVAAGWLGLDAPRSLLSIHWLARVDLAHVSRPSLRSMASKIVMTQTERRMIRRFHNLRVLTAQDGRVVQALNPAANVFVGPLGIDTRLYQYQAQQTSDPVVGLIGSIGWQPGYEAAKRLLTAIWPRIKAAVPSAHLLIVGWGARRLAADAEGRPDVTILEDVESADPFFRKLAVMAFPAAESSGMKVKVLEAMAYGVPIVTTPAGIAGIDVVNGVHARIERDDDAFARSVVELLSNAPLRDQLRRAARGLVEQNHSPQPTLDLAEAAYHSLCGSRGPTA